MKNSIFLLMILLSLGISAQETKKISSINATINNQHPDKFVLEDDFVIIKLNKASSMTVELEIQNKTDESIDFIWNETYFVLNGETVAAHNGGMSSVRMHAFHTEHVDVNKPHKIAPKAKYIASVKSSEKYVFNLFDAEKLYKKSGETLVNRVVPTLQISGENKEYPVTIELYTKKNLKGREGANK